LTVAKIAYLRPVPLSHSVQHRTKLNCAQGRIKVRDGPRLDNSFIFFHLLLSTTHWGSGYRPRENFELQMPVGEF